MPDDFSLQEELLSLASDPEAYSIDHEIEVPSLSTAEIDAHLSSAIDSVVDDPDSITHSSPTTFDVFRSILKYADSPQVSGTILTKTLDTITSSLVNHATTVCALPLDDMDAPMVHKTPLEMWAFLLQWFVVVAEKGAGKGDEGRSMAAATTGRGKTGKSKKGSSAAATSNFVWAGHIPHVLQSMHRALRVPTQRIWRTSSEKEQFVSCFTRPAYQLAETEAYLKDQEIKLGIYKVICLAVKFHSHAFGAQTSIIQNLTYFEHLAEYMAELLAILEKEFDFSQLGEEILRDVAGKSFAHNDQKGPKVFSRFLVRLAELSPRVVQKQMALLLSHLDSEAYPMRMAIIEIIGLLIQDISLSDEGDAEQKEMQIKRFFGLLMDRFLDLNAFVRGKVMATLAKLCDLPTKFPKQRAKTTDLAIRTLEDKTATCRKNAIQLLHKLIQTHPFGAVNGGSLYLPEWQERYDKLSEQLEKADAHELEKAKRDVGFVDSDEEGDAEAEGEEAVKEEPKDAEDGGETQESGDQDVEMAEGEDGEPAPKKPKSKKKPPRESQLDMAAIQAEQTALDPNLVMALRMNKKYHADALRFINAIEDAVPVLAQLLVSTNKSEALEAIRFFRIAYEYRFVGAEVGIKTMIHLIWTKDNTSTAGTEETEGGKGIRGSLIETYKSLYFDVVPDLAPKQQVNRIARNMIERTYNATLAELTSLEELMRTMMLEGGPEGGVHEDVINKLWQVYCTDSAVPKPQRQGAIIILGMLAVARREVVTEQVESLLRIGLGQHGMNDLVLARYTCIALQRLGGSAKKVKGSLADKTMRLPMDNAIFQKLQDIIERAPKSPQWFGMAEQAINTIYLLGEQPDQLCSEIIRNLTEKVFNPLSADMVGRERASTPTPGDEEDYDVPPTPAALQVPETPHIAIPATPMWNIPATPLAMERTSSQGSVKEDRTASFPLAQLVFTVGHVAIKHIVYLELVERECKRRKDEASKLKAAEKDKAVDAATNDLDAVAGNAEDDIGETIADVRERELLYGENSLLRKYGRMIAAICANPRRYRAPSLRLAATLALTKLMCVSGRFCEGHLLLLFNILEKSKDPSIRSNIVIALGDIAVSFGSLIDENSDRLYQGLSDTSGPVKKNTLMVLTHLILNGMIKVKGQLGEMAKCLEDEDPRISDLAKLFFKELSTKDNALYNNLQDVISHLSVGKFKVDEESFEKTMRFIFTFIEKDKQAEAIVEKLCQRFRLSTDERQWRDIAFCLSLLPFKSERSMKKLIEGLPFYQDKLHEERVYQRFNEILTKARSNRNPGKPETELKEFEAILAEHQAKGLEERALEADVARKTKAAKRRAAKRTAATATTSPTKKDTPVKADRPKRGRRRAAVAESDDEDEDE